MLQNKMYHNKNMHHRRHYTPWTSEQLKYGTSHTR